MDIYTFNFAKSVSQALDIDFTESIEFSDQVLYEQIITSEKKNVPGPYSASCSSMSEEEKKAMTLSANKAKRGSKETDYSRGIKSIAQKRRWSKMPDEKRKEIGRLSKIGISEEGKIRQTEGMNKAYSPVRQKGFKQQLTECPHCNKIGGAFSMKRYHFDMCKSLTGDKN